MEGRSPSARAESLRLQYINEADMPFLKML